MRLIKDIAIFACGVMLGNIWYRDKTSKSSDTNKYWQSYLMMNEWMQLKQKGRNLSEFFKERGYKNIAIYGMHHTGVTLQNELDGTGINICYGIQVLGMNQIMISIWLLVNIVILMY